MAAVSTRWALIVVIANPVPLPPPAAMKTLPRDRNRGHSTTPLYHMSSSALRAALLRPPTRPTLTASTSFIHFLLLIPGAFIRATSSLICATVVLLPP